ncbi:hypothetical protein HDE_14109 [Halotydeus destructor]|nr:hypothetical protein HDE_14109 [Halotydeus destructor]
MQDMAWMITAFGVLFIGVCVLILAIICRALCCPQAYQGSQATYLSPAVAVPPPMNSSTYVQQHMNPRGGQPMPGMYPPQNMGFPNQPPSMTYANQAPTMSYATDAPPPYMRSDNVSGTEVSHKLDMFLFGHLLLLSAILNVGHCELAGTVDTKRVLLMAPFFVVFFLILVMGIKRACVWSIHGDEKPTFEGQRAIQVPPPIELLVFNELPGHGQAGGQVTAIYHPSNYEMQAPPFSPSYNRGQNGGELPFMPLM